MKLVQHNELGSPGSVLKVVTLAAPALGVGEVRVKILAAPIHPSNLLQISGHYGVAPQLPSVPGSEGAGQIIEVGPSVDHLRVGQRVLVTGGGTWRDEVTGLAARFVPIPDNGDIEQLCMLTVNPLTALLLLNNFVALKPGDWIVQSAANSAVGEYVIQLAKQRNVKTVNIVRREDLAPGLHALGADAVVVDGADLKERINSVTRGAPISLGIDCVGGETFSRMVDCLSYGGTIVAYGALSMTPPKLNSVAVIFNDVRVRGFWLSKWFETASLADKGAAFGLVIPLVARGALHAKIDSRFSLDDIGAAVARAAESGRDGKVILCPSPT